MAQDDYVEARYDAWLDLRPREAGGSGQAATIVYNSLATQGRDNATGKTTFTGPVSKDGCGMEVGIRADLIDGTRIRADDKRFWLCGLDVTGATALPRPAVGDKLTIRGKTYAVTVVEVFALSDIDVWWFVIIR